MVPMVEAFTAITATSGHWPPRPLSSRALCSPAKPCVCRHRCTDRLRVVVVWRAFCLLRLSADRDGAVRAHIHRARGRRAKLNATAAVLVVLLPGFADLLPLCRQMRERVAAGGARTSVVALTERAGKLACSVRTQSQRPTPKRNVSDAHFFSSISVPSLRIAPVNLCAILASSHGRVTSSRT